MGKGLGAGKGTEGRREAPREPELLEAESCPKTQETFRKIHESKGFTLEEAYRLFGELPS